MPKLKHLKVTFRILFLIGFFYRMQLSEFVRILIFYLLSGFLFCSTESCMPTKTKKYKWNVSACQPEHFPAEIYRGSLHYGKAKGTPVPYGGILKSGWGSNGTTYGDANPKEVPHQLDIAWMSFRENKFYGGSFELPVAKMEKLFEDGFLDILDKSDKNVKEYFSEIIVGVGPGGLVGVWLSGLGQTVQVATFYGEEIEIDFKDFNPSGIMDRDSYVKDEIQGLPLEELKKPINYKLWETYAKMHLWKPVIQGTVFKSAITIENLHYNGNNEYLVKNEAKAVDIKTRPIPKEVRFNWVRKDGKRVLSEIKFNEEEIFQAFEEVITDIENDKAELIFNFNATKDIDVFLKAGDKQKQLETIDLKTYKSNF